MSNPYLRITKSNYLQFFRCPNAFYLIHQGAVSKPPQQFNNNLEWNEFQNLCRSLFSEAVTIEKSQDKEEAVQKTIQYIQEKKTIFYAHLQFDEYFTIIECLQYDRERDGWIIWDFRPVGSLKLDILRSFFYHEKVASSLGLPIVGNQLIRIQSSYERGEDFDLKSYLNISEISDKLRSEKETREVEWQEFLEFRKEPGEIRFDSEKSKCRSAKSCVATNFCFSNLPNQFEIFDLRDGNDFTKTWFKENRLRYEDLPYSDLSPIQKIQVDAHKSNKVHFDRKNLENFFQNVTDTVAFLDFESTNPYIPIFPKTRPFQHLPFLYSLHIWDTKTNQLVHKTFIQDDTLNDPRPGVLNALSNDLPKDITIFSFNDFFEKLIIDESSLVFPEFRPFWQEVEPRFKDLALPFKRFWVYHPRQNGKASLKEILPAFTKENHKELSIQAGQDANYQYLKLLKKQVTVEEKKTVLEDLVAYCKLDSYGLFLIYRMLREELSVSQC